VNVKEFSRYLKSERLREGLSLNDIASRSDLSISVLQALESGLFSEIGPPSLVHSYLQAYSRALGTPQSFSIHEQEPLKPVDPLDQPKAQYEIGTPRVSWVRRHLKTAVFLLAGIAALGVLYKEGWVWWKDSNPSSRQRLGTEIMRESAPPSETPTELVPPRESSTTEQGMSNYDENETRRPINNEGLTDGKDTVKGPQAELLPTTSIDKPVDRETSFIAASQLHKEGSDPGAKEGLSGADFSPDIETAAVAQERQFHRFGIEATQACWVQVRSDNKKAESALLRPGETREWEVTQEVEIVIGNAGGVLVKWDGNSVNLGGRPGQVLRFRLPHPDLTGKSP
jgi:cytoskeleton protein RodZ